MRVKKIRTPLVMNGVEVRTLKEFRENFDAEQFLEYFWDDTLLKWLIDWHYHDEADKVREIDEDAENLRPLYEIFGVNYIGSTPEEIEWYTERLERLKKFTSDENILAKVDCVAFDADDLLDILEEGEINEIYLCGAEFTFSSGMLNFKNKKYHGVGNVTVNIESKNPIDLDNFGITFDNVKFGEGFPHKKLESTNTPPVENDSENILSEAHNLFYGRNGYSKDQSRARKFYEKAARLGNVEAQKQLLNWYYVPLSRWK